MGATADTHKLPSLEWSDEDCLAEWRVRSNLRSKYPGAGAIEFQNFIQIMLEDCLGWDIKKNKRKTVTDRQISKIQRPPIN